MKLNRIMIGVGLSIAALANGQTTEVSPSVFRVESGVVFNIGNAGASDYLFSWTDSSGTVTDEVDPTLILTAGETYTFRRTSSAHPYVITDTNLPISGTDGSYIRTTASDVVIDGATLDPIADFTADPAPTTDEIVWSLTGAEIGDYFYTCRVTGHVGMTGRIEVVAGAADQRDVQIRSIDFDAGIIEMYNYGAIDQDLSGWRACSHDFDEVRLYSGASGFNGVTIEAGTSIFIHFNNDAPVDPDRLNRSALGGGFATPLDRDAYGLQMYFPNGAGVVSFGDSSLIADHLQWNINGMGAGGAEFRTNQAVSEGLWTDTGDFIATSAFTESITLTDNGDGRLHGPANYTAEEPCAPDLNGDGTLDFFDVSFFLSNTIDFNGDTIFDFFDVSLFLQAFGNGCP